MRANSSGGFAVVRRVLSLGVGAGINKRHPKMENTGTTSNTVKCHECDTVNLVDVDISELDDNDIDGWVPEFAVVHRAGNFIKFT